MRPSPASISADALLIVGSNPRREAAVLNARIRKRWRAGNFLIGLIGEKADLTYNYDYLGAGAESLANLGKSKFAEALKAAERPLVLIGAGALARPDGAAVAALAAKAAIEFGALKDGWNGYSVLHSAASRVAALDLGLVPGAGGLDAAKMATGGVDVLLGAAVPDAAEEGPLLVVTADCKGVPLACKALPPEEETDTPLPTLANPAVARARRRTRRRWRRWGRCIRSSRLCERPTM